MQTLISVFDDRTKAREAVSRLLDAGFAQADIELRETEADGRGRWVLRVDAHRDPECESAAAILHEQGAIDGDVTDASEGVSAANAQALGALGAWAKRKADDGEMRALPFELWFALVFGPAAALTRTWVKQRTISVPPKTRAALEHAAWLAVAP